MDRKVAENHGWLDQDGFVKEEYSGIIHPYMCCSGLNGKFYILGRVMHTFHRIKLEACGKNLDGTPHVEVSPERRRSERNIHKDEFEVCGKYYACKGCLGTTNGGTKRWFDVGKLLEEVVEYDPMKVCEYCYDVEYVRGQVCETCGHSSSGDRPTTAPAYDLVGFLGTRPKPKFYLVLDDCLSCT